MDELHGLTETFASVPNYKDETVVNDAIEAWLHEETDVDVTRDNAGSVVAHVSPGVGESLVLVSRHDMVPPTDRQIADSGDYVVETRDGRFYGRGAADMRGAVAASMFALRDATADVDPGIAFAPFIGGEISGEGVRVAPNDGLELDYAIVAEGSTNHSGPNRADVAVARRGRRTNTPATSGAVYHASEPKCNGNAVYCATDVVDVVRGPSMPGAEVPNHPVSGSVVITEIDGGSAWNVILDRCEMTLDERTVPDGSTDLAQTAELEDVERVVEQDLLPMTCDDANFVERVLDAVWSVREARNDAEPEQMTKPHAADVGWLAQAGATCAVYGPSEPNEAHTRDEGVSFGVLARCYKTYCAPVADW